MKKVFLNAIMIMAFSGVSLANGIAEKEMEIKSPVTVSCQESVAKFVFAADCNLVKFMMYNIAIEHGYTKDQASDYSYASYFRCMSDNLTKTPF